MKHSGRFFTWNNKQCGERRVFSKIDRILYNELWNEFYLRAEVLFLPERTFDHSLIFISFDPFVNRPFRFQFCNFWAYRKSFLGVVEKQWSCVVEGTLSFQIQSKLNSLKRLLKADFIMGLLKLLWMQLKLCFIVLRQSCMIILEILVCFS